MRNSIVTIPLRSLLKTFKRSCTTTSRNFNPIRSFPKYNNKTFIIRSSLKTAYCYSIVFASYYSPLAVAYSTMSTHVTTRDGNGVVTISPRDETKQSALVVISHGLGDSAEGFVDVAEVCYE